jgi:hypothetical protein
MLQFKLRMGPLQVEDGTWRVVIFGSSKDALSLYDRPFKSREEAVAAIKGLEDIRCSERGSSKQKVS